MTTMEVYWKESYNIILIMGRWALAAMRKQKGEFERAQCTHKRAKRDAAWFVFRSTGKMDYTARLLGSTGICKAGRKTWRGK